MQNVTGHSTETLHRLLSAAKRSDQRKWGMAILRELLRRNGNAAGEVEAQCAYSWKHMQR